MKYPSLHNAGVRRSSVGVGVQSDSVILFELVQTNRIVVCRRLGEQGGLTRTAPGYAAKEGIGYIVEPYMMESASLGIVGGIKLEIRMLCGGSFDSLGAEIRGGLS
jgi:hypothetical protein